MNTGPGELYADGHYLGNVPTLNVTSIDVARAARDARLAVQSVGYTTAPAYLTAQHQRAELARQEETERWIEAMSHSTYVETFGQPRPLRLAIAITRGLTPPES